jgi:hypothetical protein
MLRINARGAVLTSIIALVLVLLFVAQWKRNEIETWRGAYAASTPDIANQDSKLDDIAEFKDDAAAPSPPDFTAANSTLGVRIATTTLRLEKHIADTRPNSSKPSSPYPKEQNGESTASTPQQKSPASP